MFAPRITPMLKAHMQLSNKVSGQEIAVLALIALIMLVGFILVFTNLSLFERYTVEDGIVEWLTVIGLLLGAFTCFSRAFQLRRYRSWLFVLGCTLIGILLFFGAGEEISWGQRIFGIQSPDYFKENNTQQETNLHNLILGGVRINLWVFSFLLTAILSIYIVVMPFLYRSKGWMQRFINYCGIPLPKVYQVIAFILLFVLSELVPHGKRAELLEAGTGFMLFLIIRYPSNSHTFNRESL